MFYSNGKILVHDQNNEQSLRDAETRLHEYMLEERSIVINTLPELQFDEQGQFPYLQLDEHVRAQDLLGCFDHEIQLCAINEGLFKKPGEVEVTYKHSFTHEELHELMHRNSEKYLELMRMQSEKAAVVKEFNGKIAQLEKEMELNAQKAIDEFEMRTVSCKLELDFINKQRKYYSIQGNELVKEEDFQAQDYQLRIEHGMADAFIDMDETGNMDGDGR